MANFVIPLHHGRQRDHQKTEAADKESIRQHGDQKA